MATTTPERVYAIASHLAGRDLALFIEDAYYDVLNLYGVPDTEAERPTRYLTAHLATLDVRRTSEESVSDMKLKYTADAAGGIGLQATPYGQEFLRLMDRYGRGDRPGIGLVVL